MAVETPGERRIGVEVLRVGDVFETKAGFLQARVRAPKTLRATEVRKPRVHAHAGAGGYDQSRRLDWRFDRGHGALHSVLMFASLTTFPHRAISALICAENCS